MNSCDWGAVNRAWYQSANLGLECDDGCDGPEAESPRCISGMCVAFMFEDQRREECTGRTTPIISR